MPDELLRSAIEEYSSPSGQWFVEHYTLGLVGAIRKAGERAAGQLLG